MASIAKITLLNESVTASTTGTKQSLSQNHSSFIVFVEVANYATLTSIDANIEHSPDGTNWFILASITQATGNTTEEIQITDNVFPNVRANVTVVGSGSADLKLELFYDPNKK